MLLFKKSPNFFVKKRDITIYMRLESIKRANNILAKELEMPAILRVQCNDKYSKDVEWRTGIWVNNSGTCFFIALIPCHHQVV